MTKGFTLIELILVLLLISFTLTTSFVHWHISQDSLLLQKEQQHLLHFLKKIQARAENTNQSWQISISRDLFSGKWCILAQRQASQICDCLYVHNCNSDIVRQTYHSHFTSKINILASKYYPTIWTVFNGERNTSLSAKLVLRLGDKQGTLSINNVGVMKVR